MPEVLTYVATLNSDKVMFVGYGFQSLWLGNDLLAVNRR